VRPAAAALLFVGVSTVATRSLAAGAVFNDPYDVPAVPRPPTLPELTHAEAEGTLETTVGAIIPNAGGGYVHAYVQRLAVEVPFLRRRWYVGASYELAASGGLVVSGNVELGIRTLWATRTGLAFGGGVDVIAPTAHFNAAEGAASVTALSAATLRPWDVSFFVPNGIGARPFVDVRAIDGPFVAQFRESLDLLTTVDSFRAPAIYGTLGLYLGLWVAPRVAAGIEAFEAYAIDVDVPKVRDGARAAVVVSPNVRLVLPWVEPAISAFTNIGTPLKGASDRIWGFRLAFTLVYDPTHTLDVRGRSSTDGLTMDAN
jgi:hypothetical protein